MENFSILVNVSKAARNENIIGYLDHIILTGTGTRLGVSRPVLPMALYMNV